ncbi:MAG: rhomboid family intramembrane serine protease [Deltaproteobacteria bacterium]|nr:MAG: rhomboid family intramembrane serine protease [Deltaproteobacteria bacterium]
MIPIRDTTPSATYPVVTTALIAVNVIFFMVQSGYGPNEDALLYLYGLVPAKWTLPQWQAHFSTSNRLFTLLSYMFLHGGIWHLIGNMWSLYIFGDNVEDHLGHLRYLLFYLLCGVVSGFSHMMLNRLSDVPTIGASGAIAGVMGAYFLLYPRARILTLIPIIIIPWFIELPAFVFLGIWFLMQLLNAAGSGAGGVAWWAHIGGFVMGMIAVNRMHRMPDTGLGEQLRQMTVRKKTPRLQIIRPTGKPDDPHLYGAIHVTAREAETGAVKLVNIPWGFYNRMVRISVPANVRSGTKLRLKDMGKLDSEDTRGDLFLSVVIEDPLAVFHRY